MPRTIAIGDIHGCSDALRALLRNIAPKPEDTIVTLGDYVNRGNDSKGVLDLLIGLSKGCRLVPLLGNHDSMFLQARQGDAELRRWIGFGGTATLDSYHSSGGKISVPDEHFKFLESCLGWFETDSHFFVHANYDPRLPLGKQNVETLRWMSLKGRVPGPHLSGKVAVVGHTAQPEILNLGHLICLDTGCGFGGVLSAMELKDGVVWQVDERGEPVRQS